jgi:hypothetical protein
VNNPVKPAQRPFSPKIDRSYPKPKLKLPPGACDCHFHFIGPQQQFTLKPNHVFSHLEFEDTTFEDWDLQYRIMPRGSFAFAITSASEYPPFWTRHLVRAAQALSAPNRSL